MSDNRPPQAWIDLHNIEADLMDNHLNPYLREGIHPDLIDDALSQSFPEAVRPHIPHTQDMFDFFVLPWVLFNWIPLNDFDMANNAYHIDHTPAANYLSLHKNSLNQAELAFMEAATGSYHNYYQIEAVDGHTFTVKDLLLGTTHTIIEGNVPYEKGDIVLARIITVGNTSIFIQASLIPFPKDMQSYVLGFKEDLQNSSDLDLKTITKQTLQQELALPLLLMYWHPFAN